MYPKMRCARLTTPGTDWFPGFPETPLSSGTAKGADMKVVVNFDVFGNVGHQVLTRVYMEKRLG